MPKQLLITIGVLVVVLLISCISVLWISAFEVWKHAPELIKPVTKLVTDLDNGANATFDNLNRLCKQDGKPCGTLADVNQTLGTIRGAVGEFEKASRTINKNQSVFFDQETEVYNHANDILTNFNSTIRYTNETLDGFRPIEERFTGVEDSVLDELTEFRRTNSDVNGYLEAPYLKDTLVNLDGTSGNINRMTTDFSNKEHEFLYPAPCKGKLCVLKRAYTITRDVGPLAEPFYYGVMTYEGIKNGKTF